MPSGIPHQVIRKVEDRDWTFRLLDVVRSPSSTAEQRSEALTTMDWVGDSRAIGPLTEILEDPMVDEAARSTASDVLRGFEDKATSEDHGRWWASGDQVLMKHALSLMCGADRSVVLATAADDDHPLQAEALEVLAFGFSDVASTVPLLLRALGHRDATVRWSAIGALYWFEAEAAHDPLIAAAQDVDEDVAVRAVESLEYFVSRRVLRALSDVAKSASGELQEAAGNAFSAQLGSFESAIERCAASSCEREQMADWLRPVADLIPPPEPDEEWDDPPAAPAANPVSVDELRRWLADPGGEWAAKKQAMRQPDWTQYSAADRETLTALFAIHFDPTVRSSAAHAFAQWSDTERLRTLMNDACGDVRRSATRAMSLLQRDESLAPLAWAAMQRETDTPSTDALDTYVVHAPRGQALDRLETLAREDPRVEVRMRSVSKLRELKADAQVRRLAVLLNEPPHTHWSLHASLLDAIRELDLPTPDLTQLEDVDDLDLHVAIVRLRCR